MKDKDKDKEAFEKWCDLNGYLHIVEDFLYEAWQAACEDKDKEILEYKEAARSESEEVNSLQAENKKLREALEFYADYRNWKVCYGESWRSTLNKEDCSLLNCGGGRARVALKEIKEN